MSGLLEATGNLKLLVEVGPTYPEPSGYGRGYSLGPDDTIAGVDLFKTMGIDPNTELSPETNRPEVQLPFKDGEAEKVILSDVVGHAALTASQNEQLLAEARRIVCPRSSIMVRDLSGRFLAHSILVRVRGFDITECAPGSAWWPHMQERYNLGKHGVIYTLIP